MLPPAVTPPPPSKVTGKGLIDCTNNDLRLSTSEKYDDDVHRFGGSIAECLKEERIALRRAQNELVQANAKAAASAKALVAIYGPNVAAGNADSVVEPSFRGGRATTRVATLLSTLQACPDSALARRFDESTWPVTDKDKDCHGRRVIHPGSAAQQYFLRFLTCCA